MKLMTKVIILTLILICKTANSLNPNDTLYTETVSAFNLMVDKSSDQNEKIQAQKEYLRCIQELSRKKDNDSIIKILNEHWTHVSIKNEENDWEAKTIFDVTIKSLIPKEYSNETIKVFLYLESFIFNSQFFDYGKQAIISEIIYSGLYKNDPDYIIDLILRVLEDDSLSFFIKKSALQLSSYKIVNDEMITIVSDRINESKSFKEILFTYIQDQDSDFMLRRNAMAKLGEADNEKCDYKDLLTKYIDNPNEPTLNESALRSVQNYKDSVLTQRAIDYLYMIIEKETGNDFVKDYSLFYTCNLTKHNVDGVHLVMRSLTKSGTDNVVDFFSKIIYAGLTIRLQKNEGNVQYLTECIELIGETKNYKAIPILIDIYDNYSLKTKSGNFEKVRLKKAALVGLSYFEKEEVYNILQSRYTEYIIKYRSLNNKRADDRIQLMINR